MIRCDEDAAGFVHREEVEDRLALEAPGLRRPGVRIEGAAEPAPGREPQAAREVRQRREDKITLGYYHGIEIMDAFHLEAGVAISLVHRDHPDLAGGGRDHGAIAVVEVEADRDRA